MNEHAIALHLGINAISLMSSKSSRSHDIWPVETPYTVLAPDGKALARAVCRLLAAPQEAAQRGRQAATRVRQVFSRDRFLQDTLAVYREVAAARGGR